MEMEADQNEEYNGNSGKNIEYIRIYDICRILLQMSIFYYWF